MSKIYTLVNQKGGVGKTTTTINLGAYLAYFGQRVLLVDIDPQSNATSCLGIDKHTVTASTYDAMMDNIDMGSAILHNPRLKISILPAAPGLAGAEVELVSELARETRLREALKKVEDRYDYILIDCPPSLGLLTLNGIVAARDGLIIPVQCEYLALEGLGMLLETVERIRSAIFSDLDIRAVVMTMFDTRTNLSRDVVEEVSKHFPNKVMESVIPRSVRLAEAPSYGLPILAYYPDSPGAEAYEKLARELLKQDGVKLAV